MAALLPYKKNQYFIPLSFVIKSTKWLIWSPEKDFLMICFWWRVKSKQNDIFSPVCSSQDAHIPLFTGKEAIITKIMINLSVRLIFGTFHSQTRYYCAAGNELRADFSSVSDFGNIYCRGRWLKSGFNWDFYRKWWSASVFSSIYENNDN